MTLQSDKAVCVGGWNGFHVALVMKSYKLFLSLSSKKEGTPSSIRREVRWLNNTELRSFYSVKDTLTTIWHVTKHQIICELWTLSKAKNKSYCMHQSPISSEKKGVFFYQRFSSGKIVWNSVSGSSICRRRLASFRVKNTLCMWSGFKSKQINEPSAS